MSLLEDARQTIKRAVRTVEYEGRNATVCHLCSWARTFWDDQAVEHSADCPVPALPKIVAALEAAERVVRESGYGYFMKGGGYYRRCRYCSMSNHGPAPDFEYRGLVPHDAGCPYLVLKEAFGP